MKRKILYVWSSNFKPSRQKFLYKFIGQQHIFTHIHTQHLFWGTFTHSLRQSLKHWSIHSNTRILSSRFFFFFFKLIQFDWLPLFVCRFFLFQWWCCCCYSASFSCCYCLSSVNTPSPSTFLVLIRWLLVVALKILRIITQLWNLLPQNQIIFIKYFFVVFSLDCYTKNKLTFIFQFYHILWRLSVSK